MDLQSQLANAMKTVLVNWQHKEPMKLTGNTKSP